MATRRLLISPGVAMASDSDPVERDGQWLGWRVTIW
jgi:hypothetical protein